MFTTIHRSVLRLPLRGLLAAALGLAALIGAGPARAQAVAVEPQQLDFGAVQVGTTRSMAIRVTNTAGVRFKPQVALDLGDGFGFAVANNSVLRPGQAMTITVYFVPPVAGPFSGSVTVTDPRMGPMVIPVQGVGVGGAVAVLPARLECGPVLLGGNVTRHIAISNAGNRPITLNEARRLAVGSFMAYRVLTPTPLVIPPGATAQVAVEFTPERLGEHPGSLRLSSPALGPTGRLDIPLGGTGVLPLRLNFLRLAFGKLLPGDEIACRDICITNAGEAPAAVHVEVAGLDPERFQVEPRGWLELLPGETRRVRVMRIGAGKASGELVLESELLPEGRIVVPVTAGK